MGNPHSTCSVPDCTHDSRARGWCEMHYRRWRRHGDTDSMTRTISTNRSSIEDRFWSKVDTSAGADGCWLWRGYLDADGYGHFNSDSNQRAHRYSYELQVGAIPEGLTIDHLCRIRHCVNPTHLEPVTMRVNVLRGHGEAAANARKTHCPKGHEYTPENSILNNNSRRYSRRCRTCDKQRKKKEYTRRVHSRGDSRVTKGDTG